MNIDNTSLYVERKKMTRKEIIFGSLLVCGPIIIFFLVMISPSFSNDLDVRVLYGNILFFLFLAICTILAIIGLISYIIKNAIKKIKKQKADPLTLLILILIILCMMAYGSYHRFEDALKDFHADDLYLTGVVEKTTPENDGTPPTVKFAGDPNVYDLYQISVVLEKGAQYHFKYYENCNLLYLLEEMPN